MQSVYLSKIEPENNTFRFYRLVLPRGSRDLLLQWGRIGEYLTERWQQHESHKAALKALEATKRQKLGAGYNETDERVLPKNYLLYQPPNMAVKPNNRQLSFFNEIEGDE